MAGVWAAFPKLLLRDFWFPIHDTHVVRNVAVPSQACEDLCSRTANCCRWGVREVRAFEEAKNANQGLSEFGWEVHGSAWAQFKDNLNADNFPQWCTVEACGNAAGNANFRQLSITVEAATKKVNIMHGNNAAVPPQNPVVAVLTAPQIPGKDDAVFYFLVTADRWGWKFWDKDGNKIGDVVEADVTKNLEEDPDMNLQNSVVWVKSFSCGLFRKEDARAARLRAMSLTSGLLKRCGGDGGKGGKGGKGHESIVDADKAFQQAVAQFNGRGGVWSVDASAASPGISYASILCAVFSSVALVFLVLFAANRNSQLEVVVADE